MYVIICILVFHHSCARVYAILVRRMHGGGDYYNNIIHVYMPV